MSLSSGLEDAHSPTWHRWPGEGAVRGGLSVWLCRDAEPDAAAAIAICRDCLSDEELARMTRFRFPALRQQFAIAHGFVRHVLSLFHPQVAPRDWRFDTGAQGKPEVATGLPRVGFNLSHATGLVALAVAYDETGVFSGDPVGVDVEQATRNIGPGIARRYFAPEEVTDLEALPEPEQRDRFFALWSLKESYIKATGYGLSMPLDSFSFAFDAPGCVSFRRHPDRLPPEFATDHFTPVFWQTMLSSPAGERHSLALCTGAGTLQDDAITVFETVPGRAVRRLDPVWDRRPAET
ncbi:4'-phosphopantetheinyl transferase superfamily protein [Stappia sp. MMSF_3263]|uniref:4'-phosphopantetheinyl transferase family protein n=1 Tax=Stappia sp. MMSF_3263 TaxID=3046693 RepID=UPI00273FE4A9|nr:4'-phosphopantetheinyl transferase superfamily protein [Stappia sp. MMSF_3263]